MVDINNNNDINGGASTSDTSTCVNRIIGNKIGPKLCLHVTFTQSANNLQTLRTFNLHFDTHI